MYINNYKKLKTTQISYTIKNITFSCQITFDNNVKS